MDDVAHIKWKLFERGSSKLIKIIDTKFKKIKKKKKSTLNVL